MDYQSLALQPLPPPEAILQYHEEKMSKLSFLLCLILATIFVVVVNGSESEVGIYELKKGDFSLKVTNFGARIISLVLPDKNGTFHFLLLHILQCSHGKLPADSAHLFPTCSGKPTDVVLGYDSVKEYLVSNLKIL